MQGIRAIMQAQPSNAAESTALWFGTIDASAYTGYELPVAFILVGVGICGFTAYLDMSEFGNGAYRRIPKSVRSFVTFMLLFTFITFGSDAEAAAFAIATGFFGGSFVVGIVKLRSILIRR